MAAVQAFYDLCCHDLNLLNKANIILLPKKDGAENVRDFRPISLIHAIAKIFTKVLALRLAPLMGQLISTSQSAFIKKRNIHDNFLYVRNLTRRFHRTKTSALLLKLDISKAFDSVRWDYLLSVMQHRGFPTRWQNWVTTLLSSSSLRIMLNGTPLLPIQHGRGLRLGDLLSPLLFILAIEPLNQLL
jgi:mannosylglycoprotein endo-beta-mannosidase